MNEELSQFTNETPGRVTTNVESLYSTRSWRDIEDTRNQALTDYMAGVTERVNPLPTEFTNISGSANKDKDLFENYNDALAKVNLIDENLNPTSTYTNYIGQGGTPIPGYEAEDANFKFIDKMHDYQERVDTGEMTENQMLWDLYGLDILETSGYKLRSVGWWQSKYQNNDFANPLTNQYLVSTVLDNAKEYHNSLLAKEYAHQKKVNQSNLASFLNKGDLSNEDIKKLFPELTEAIDNLDTSHDYEWWVTTNRLNPADRIYTTDTGDRYYLHTDGELYKLTNEEKGPKTLQYTENKDGQIIEISKGGSDLLDVGSEFKAGLFSGWTGFEKLAMGLWGGTIGYGIQGLSTGDWDYVNSITNSLDSVDQFHNDYESFIYNSRRIDMDGFKYDEGKDWACFVSNMFGSIAGGMITGGIASSAAKWGAGLVAGGNKLGYVPQVLGNLYARSTGLYRGYTGTTGPNAFTLLGHSFGNLAGWAPQLNHMKTVAVYMLKDFNNNLQSLNTQRIQYMLNNPDEEIEYNNNQILGVAFANAAFNGIVSSIFAGGIDDNQVQRWLSLTAPSEQVTTKNLATFLAKHYVGVNIFSEYLDNLITTYSGNLLEWSPDNDFWEMTYGGAFKNDENGNKRFDTTLLFKTAIQAGIMTAPQAQSMLQRKNIALDNAQGIWTQVLKDIDEAGTTPESKVAMANLKADIIEQFNNTEGDMVTRIFTVLDDVQGKLQDTPGQETVITKAINKVANPKMQQYYKMWNDMCQEDYKITLAKYKDLTTDLETDGIRTMLSKGIRRKFANRWTSLDNAMKNTGTEDYADAMARGLYNYFVTSTMSKKSEDAALTARELVEVTADQIKNVKDTSLNYNEFSRTHNKEAQAAAQNAAEAMAKQLGVDPEVVKAATKYFTLHNETDDRSYYNSNQAAMLAITKLMPESFYKIDDYTYGLLGSDSQMVNLFNENTLDKLTLSMHVLNQGTEEAMDAGVDLYLKTVLGDNVSIKDETKKNAKALVEGYLKSAIDTGVIKKYQAAEFLLSLKNQDNDLGKDLKGIFEIELTNKDVTNPNMTDLERYALIYRATMHLQQPENKRFSGPTIAAQVLLNDENPINKEVISDLVKNNLLSSNFEKIYREQLEGFYSKNDVFNYATDKFLKEVVEVIGQAGITDLPEGEQLHTWLKNLAQNASDETIKARAQDLLKFGDTLRTFQGVTFDGDDIIFDLTSYMTKDVMDFIKEVSNTDSGAENSRRERDSYANKPSDTKAKDFVTQMDELVAQDKGLVHMNLKEASIEDINYFFDIMYNAGMFTNIVTRRPNDANEFKKYLKEYLTPLGESFVRINDGTKYIAKNIISEADSKIIKEKLKTAHIDNTISRFKEIHPNDSYVAEYDYYTLMLNNLDIKKISSTTSGYRVIDNDHAIVVNPVKFGTEKDNVPAFIKLLTGVKAKTGRTASQTGETYAAISDTTQAYNVNKDMATKFALLSMVDKIYELDAIDVVITDSQYKDLFERGFIDREDSFYQTVMTPDSFSDDSSEGGHLRLRLSKDKAFMKEYIETNKKINLYKIFPFYGSEEANTSIAFNSPGGLKMPDVKGRGLTTWDNLYEIIDMSFDYDQSGNLKSNLWKEFFEAHDKLDYNPFTEYNIPLNMKKVKDLVDANRGDYILDETGDYYIAYRNGKIAAGVDDAYYALLETYDQLEKSYTDDVSNDDSKLWLTEGNVLKRMVQAAKDNVEYNEAFEKEILKAYTDAHYARNLSAYSQADYLSRSTGGFVVGNSYGLPSNITDVDTVMSKRLLDNDMGISYRLTNEDGTPVMAPEIASRQLRDAYEYIKYNINKFDTIEDITNNTDSLSNMFRIYEPSEIVKLAAITGASDDRISIDDLDTLSRMEAESYRIYYDEILGMGEGYGEKVYGKILSLQEQLLKYSNTSNAIPQVYKGEIQATKIPTRSNISESFQAIPVGSDSSTYKNISPYIKKNYINYNEEALKTSDNIDRFINSYGDYAKKFTDDLVKSNEKDKYKKAWMDQVGETIVRDNSDIDGNTMIGDISSDIYLTKRLNSTRNTHDSLITNVYKDVSVPKDAEDNLISYSTTLVNRATGTQMLGTWAKYSFMNPENGTEITNAVTDNNAGDLDLLNAIMEQDKKLIGSVFINLDKHEPDSVDGLSYTMKKINNDEDLIQLKTDVFMNVFKTVWEKNRYLVDNKFKSVEDMMIKMTPTEMNAFLQKVRKENLTNIVKTRYLMNQLQDTNIDKVWEVLLKPQNYKNDAAKNYIAENFGEETAARFDKDPQVRRIYNAVMYGIDRDSMSDVHKNIHSNVVKSLAEEYSKNFDKELETSEGVRYWIDQHNKREMTDTEWNQMRRVYGITPDMTTKDYEDVVYRYLVDNSDSPEVLSYLYNKHKSLNTMYKDSLKKNKEFYTLNDNSKVLISDLNDFFTEGTKSPLKKIIGFDTESSNVTKENGQKANSIRDLFQISFKIYTKDELGNLHEETITKFIKHPNITAEEWVENSYNINKNDLFFKSTKSYQEALEAYKITPESDMLTYDQVADILTGRLSGSPDFVIAYNGNNFEFNVLAKELGDTRRLDAIATVLKSYGDTTEKMGQEDVYKRSISADYGEKHDAEEDTTDMMDLIKKTINTNTYMDEDRYRLTNNIKKLTNLDDKELSKVLTAVNKMFRNNQELSSAYKEFDHYEPSLDNIKMLQRGFNYLQNNRDGKAVFQLMQDLDAYNYRAKFVKMNSPEMNNAKALLS